MEEQDNEYDVVVIGGGPAGLAAGLWLGRFRQRVLILDAEDPRNEESWAVHGYLGLDDIPPLELRRKGREQARAEGAGYDCAIVASVSGQIDSFQAELEDGRTYQARRILLATGVRDIIPEIPGLTDFYGSSIWHCPDCDGPGVEGLRVGVIGWGRQIAAFCMEMLTWTDQLTILTHGKEPELPQKSRAALERFSIPVRTDVIQRIEGEDGCVQRAVFDDGSSQPFDAMFFHIAYGPGCGLAPELGCDAGEDGTLATDDDCQTTVPGVFAAGDITHGSKLAIRAAADGTRAAIGIYRSLLPEDRRV